MQKVAAAALAFALAATRADACSCARRIYSGFLPEAPAIHLPANARGALYYTEKKPGKFKVTDDGKQVKFTVRTLSNGALRRVEPAGGMKAGHRYTFMNGKRRLDATVDLAKVELTSKSVTMRMGHATTELLQVPKDASCGGEDLVRVRRADFEAADALLPYARSLLYFVSVDGQPWSYLTYSCSQPRFGRDDAEPGKAILYASCARSRIPLDKPVEVNALWGFLEIEDELLRVESTRLTFTGGADCDKEAFFKRMATTSKEICRMANSDSMMSPVLVAAIVKEATSADVEARRCSVSAMSAIPYLLPDKESEVTPVLKARLSDEDAEVRRSASIALENFERVKKDKR